MDILIILALILLNGIFAMSELAVVSSKRIRLQNLADNGSRGARAALQLADHPSRFLSTVQVGITLIGIFNGAFGEASLVARLTPQIASVPMLAEYAREVALGIVVMGITFASIVLGELVPKRIAMQYPETVATLIAAPMQGLSKIVSPFVKVLSVATDAIIRLLGLHKPKEDSVTQEEITGMLREGADAGVFERTEHDIVTRALRLDDQRLGALMTPRTDIEFIDLEDDIDHNLAKIADSPYSRFPVCRGDRSNILGIVHAGSEIQDYNLQMGDAPARVWMDSFPPFLEDYVKSNGVKKIRLYFGTATFYFKVAKRASEQLLAKGLITEAVQYHVVDGSTRNTPLQHGSKLLSDLARQKGQGPQAWPGIQEKKL